MHEMKPMKSPILQIRPIIPAQEQGERICSMATRGKCAHPLVAEVQVLFEDGTRPRWNVCGEWLTGHPDAITHITNKGFAPPAEA
ncbi:hypothetical protein [Streptomyces sp. NPDC002685]|uniref:hypothetical protein n=1 Tax=Streptomyces sp. NPDC002685 TaxID=3154540 RepID=UPI00331EB349